MARIMHYRKDCRRNHDSFSLPPFRVGRWSDLDVCTEYSLGQMEAATDGWSPDNILGEGGYAVVYKGVSPKGQLWAVKRAKVMTNDFEAEVSVSK